MPFSILSQPAQKLDDVSVTQPEENPRDQPENTTRGLTAKISAHYTAETLLLVLSPGAPEAEELHEPLRWLSGSGQISPGSEGTRRVWV